MKEPNFERRKKFKKKGVENNMRYTHSQPLLKIRGMEKMMTTEMTER
jgi:hypothetical protein